MKTQLLTLLLAIATSVQAQIARTSEQTALDGLLSITEAQTRFAVRNGRYAASISELGLQTSIMSAGQLTMKSAFDADLDNPKRIPADGYFFRVLPVRGESGNESNSFWVAAIPDQSRNDLPVYFTIAYHVNKITFPLVNWWALRIHETNRFLIAKTFTTEAAVTIQSIGLVPDNPESFPNGRVVSRFTFDSKGDYPPTAQPPPPFLHSRMLLFIGVFVIALFILLISRKTKRK